MKKKYNFEKALQACYVLLLMMMTGTNVSAQVGIGTTTPNAALDITSANDGLLIPRVSLLSTNSLSTTSGSIDSPMESELVYNINTSGIGSTAVTPGYYYLNPAANGWIRLGSGADAAPGWSLTGNASTIPGTNFLGTTDTQPLIIKTNNTERMRITSAGNVGIGSTSPSEKLEITNGNIFMNSTTRQFISWSAGGTGVPSFRDRSAGTKLVLYPQVGAATSDYAIGVENDAIWYGVPSTASGYSHKFYAGTSPLMTIWGDGNVGIGTGNTAPLAKLDVVGTARISTLGGGGINNQMVVANNNGVLSTQSIPSGADNLGNHTATLPLNMSSNPIHSASTIGVGTNNPQTQLDVVGNAQIRGLNGTGDRMVVAGPSGLLATRAIP